MRRVTKSSIPDDLQGVLKDEDINEFFFYLETEFHLSKQWRVDFHSEVLRQSRQISETEFFCVYVMKNKYRTIIKAITKEVGLCIVCCFTVFIER